MDFAKSAQLRCDFVRGMTPWPGAYAGPYKVLEAASEPYDGPEDPGVILRADPKGGLAVRAGEGALRILRMQAAGGKPMNACDYLRGHQMEVGALIAPEKTDAE